MLAFAMLIFRAAGQAECQCRRTKQGDSSLQIQHLIVLPLMEDGDPITNR
jgi:hypothetical protein